MPRVCCCPLTLPLIASGGALSFWDYATAAPYVDIDMNPAGYNDADEVRDVRDVAKAATIYVSSLVALWN